MSFENDFLDLLNDTITVNTNSSYIDAYGNTKHSTASSTYAGRLVHKQKMVRTDEGEERLSTHHAIVASTAAISPKSKITLADGTNPLILASEAYPDESGSYHHVKLYF